MEQDPPSHVDLISGPQLHEANLLLQALQDQLLGMEEKAAGLVDGEVGDGSPRPSALDATDVLPKEGSSSSAGPSVAAVLEVASALEAKLEV